MTDRRLGWRVGLLAAWAALAVYAVWGAGAVPFHPDESTFLYMSRDFDLLFVQGRPGAVTWQAAGQPALVQRYRLLDAPLGRYLAGLGRALAGQPYLAQDWDWSATWDDNVAAGALPDSRALAAARLPATVLTALSCLLVYGIGKRLGGRGTGVTAAALYALSGLALLHGRRAMSEGPLLFFTLLTIWLLLRDRPNPALMALALAAAIAAKLTALVLLPVAIVSLLPPAADWRRAETLRPALGRVAIFGGVWLVSLWALQPALWASPIAGLQAMQAARQAFFDEQRAFVESIAPHLRLAQPGLRALGMLYHVYFAPLAYADVGQYAAATAAAEQRYAAVPLNPGWHTPNLSANLVIGGLLLGLSLIGMIQAVRGLRPSRRVGSARATGAGTAAPASTRARLLVLVCTFATMGGLLAVAVPAQRYYLPLLPLACLWAADGLFALALPFRRASRRAGRAPLTTHD